MIYKIRCYDRIKKKDFFLIMGDSYKPFKDHFLNVVGYWTQDWHYKDDSKHSECYGRTIRFDVLDIWSSKDKFVSFGGLKSCDIEDYDEYVERHNLSGSYEPCKYLRHIIWIKEDKKFIEDLLKSCGIITNEKLQKCRIVAQNERESGK